MAKSIFGRVVMLLVLLGIGRCLKAQNVNDSLWNIWGNTEAQNDVRAKALYDFIMLNENNSFDSVLVWLNGLISFSEQNGLTYYAGKGKLNLGSLYGREGENPRVLKFYKEAEVLFRSINDEKGAGGALINIGLEYENAGDLNKAFKYINQGILLCAKVNAMDYVSNAYNGLALICGELGENEGEKKYLLLSLKASRSFGDTTLVIVVANNLAAFYAENGEYEKAFKWIEKCRQFAERKNNFFIKCLAYINKGSIYLEKGNIDSSGYYFLLADALIKQNFSIPPEVGLKTYMGQLKIIEEKWGDAITLCKDALILNRQFRVVSFNREICECLYNSYKGGGNLPQALFYHEKMLALEDSINKEGVIAKIKKAEFDRQQMKDSLAQAELTRIEQLEYQEQVAEKQRKNRIQYSLVVIVVLLLATIIAVATRFSISPRLASGLIFIFFILLFEFLLVVLDPWVDSVSNGEVGWKIGINTAIALVLFGVHQVSEKRLRSLLIKSK